MATNKIKWDAEMDRKLFLAILKVYDIVVDTKAVANELSTEDQPCTAMAIQKRLQKIKAQIKDGVGEGTADDEPGTGTPKSKAKSPRKRAATVTAGVDDESPTKKGKGKGGKSKKAAVEDEDDEEAGAEAAIKTEEN